jgi:hypothetical protein
VACDSNGTCNNNQARILYYTDRGPDVGYSVNNAYIQRSSRAMLDAAFQARVRQEWFLPSVDHRLANAQALRRKGYLC